MENTACPCQSDLPYAACCRPLHQGAPAADAPALMRSRYAAYVLHRFDYIQGFSGSPRGGGAG